MNNLPDWMQKQENYIPRKDRDSFITRNLLSVMSALSLFKSPGKPGISTAKGGCETASPDPDSRSKTVEFSGQTVDVGSKKAEFGSQTGRRVRQNPNHVNNRSRHDSNRAYGFTMPVPSASMKLLMALVIIVLASCSRNMFFTYTMLAALLVHMCFIGERQLKRVFGAALAAAAFSALVLVPAVFLGSPHTLITVSLKVFLSVGLLAIMSVTTPWNRITEGLRRFHVPDIFIFTFDITLKYIVIIGDICLDMLDSLKLRSVGRNTTKKKSFSGILGVVFLKSRHMSEEMCGAMACRGFEGEYSKGSRAAFAKSDVLFLLFTALIVLYFFYL